jgi:hypothetical protein
MRGGDIDRGERSPIFCPGLSSTLCLPEPSKAFNHRHAHVYPEIVYIANEALNGKDESNALHDIDLNMIESPL